MIKHCSEHLEYINEQNMNIYLLLWNLHFSSGRQTVTIIIKISIFYGTLESAKCYGKKIEQDKRGQEC